MNTRSRKPGSGSANRAGEPRRIIAGALPRIKTGLVPGSKIWLIFRAVPLTLTNSQEKLTEKLAEKVLDVLARIADKRITNKGDVMKKTDNQAAWAIFIERKADRKESRVAFIAALIMERCTFMIVDEPTPQRVPAHHAAIYAAEFVRLAVSIHSLCEASCNYELSPGQETRLENLRDRFTRLANALGFEAETGGDPRGPCARLIDPDDRRGDGFGEGFAVYA
jgi:hypothetical protein